MQKFSKYIIPSKPKICSKDHCWSLTLKYKNANRFLAVLTYFPNIFWRNFLPLELVHWVRTKNRRKNTAIRWVRICRLFAVMSHKLWLITYDGNFDFGHCFIWINRIYECKLDEKLKNRKMGQNHSDRRKHVANWSNVDIYVQV